MEDLSAMLSSLMNSPEQMEKFKAMAGSLLGQSAPAEPTAPPELKADEIAGIVKMAGLLKNSTADPRAGVLLSIRPHLSPQRQKRVDDAVKILRLISILPAVKEAGIL